MHRYKKNRPTHYSTDRTYHLNLKAEALAVKEAVAGEEAMRKGSSKKLAAAKKRSTKAAEAAAAAVAALRAEETGAGREDRDTSVLSSVKGGTSSRESSPAAQPVRPTSRARKRLRSDSLSEAPSDSRETSAGPSTNKPLHVRLGGRGRRASSSDSSSELSPAPLSAMLPSAAASAPPKGSRTTPAAPKPPQWMLEQIAALREEYKDDKVELLQKPRKDDTPSDAPVEWRLRCLDCPGKVRSLLPPSPLEASRPLMPSTFARCTRPVRERHSPISSSTSRTGCVLLPVVLCSGIPKADGPASRVTEARSTTGSSGLRDEPGRR